MNLIPKESWNRTGLAQQSQEAIFRSGGVYEISRPAP
jgi:hypothetical protein